MGHAAAGHVHEVHDVRGAVGHGEEFAGVAEARGQSVPAHKDQGQQQPSQGHLRPR